MQQHQGIEYGDVVHISFKDFLEVMPEIPPFRIVPKKQVFIHKISCSFKKTSSYPWLFTLCDHYFVWKNKETNQFLGIVVLWKTFENFD